MNFLEFYLQGGLFMHLITLAALAAGAQLIKGVGERRRGERELPRLVLIRGFNHAALLCGALGTLFGFTEVAAALTTVDMSNWTRAALAGSRIAIIPLIYSLMVYLPLSMCAVALQYSSRSEAPTRRA